MKIELTNEYLCRLNHQTVERTAERLVYNAADILKIAVHQDVYNYPELVDAVRAGAVKLSLKKGYGAEVKLALAHIIVSCFTLADQINISEAELEQLVKDTIVDHQGEW